jgi:rare lipoprotein A (peptidoglycan hydrolase)
MAVAVWLGLERSARHDRNGDGGPAMVQPRTLLLVFCAVAAATVFELVDRSSQAFFSREAADPAAWSLDPEHGFVSVSTFVNATADHDVDATLARMAETWYRAPPDSAGGPDLFEQFGIASWYGQWHHGRRTASGEPFDMFKLTAAHRSLPLGTTVRVTNLDNGRSVDVTINDRGPYVGDRVIDLSWQAARTIEMEKAGIVPVMIEELPKSLQAAGARPEAPSGTVN